MWVHFDVGPTESGRQLSNTSHILIYERGT